MDTPTSSMSGLSRIYIIAPVIVLLVLAATALWYLAYRRGDSTAELNFSLDAMSRSIRTGTTHSLTGSTQITFLAADGLTTSYCRGSGTLCGSSGTTILRSTGAGYSPVISPEVVVTALTFYLVGNTLLDNTQPKITILLRGYVQVTATQRSSFDLQTTVTQRLYDQ